MVTKNKGKHYKSVSIPVGQSKNFVNREVKNENDDIITNILSDGIGHDEMTSANTDLTKTKEVESSDSTNHVIETFKESCQEAVNYHDALDLCEKTTIAYLSAYYTNFSNNFLMLSKSFKASNNFVETTTQIINHDITDLQPLGYIEKSFEVFSNASSTILDIISNISEIHGDNISNLYNIYKNKS